MSGSVAVFCLYPDDLTPVTREGEEKPHKQLIISSHPPPRHPSCPILPTTRDCSWMATPSNPSIFVRQMHHGTIIMGYFFPRDSGKKHLHSHSCTVDRTVHVARVDDPTVVIVSGRLKGFLLPNLCSGSYQLSSLAAVSASAIMSSTPPPP